VALWGLSATSFDVGVVMMMLAQFVSARVRGLGGVQCCTSGCMCGFADRLELELEMSKTGCLSL